MSYDHKSIEKKWQERWEKEGVFNAPDKVKLDKKKYILDMFPYPSGAGLHVGHPEGYTATDIYSRYLRMKGFQVLHPMGWDAFGLPAENYAIKSGVHPKASTENNIKTFTRQIKALGFSYDWSREVNTSDPNYYKWTQWLFLQLYKAGLAYKKAAPVNWCADCQTVLANEQVVDGACERCHNKVIQKNLEQWFFKITGLGKHGSYPERLLSNLERLDWPEPIKTMQRNWIGKSEGAEIEFQVASSESRALDFVLLHAYKGSPKEKFFPWLKQELEKRGHKVYAPQLPNPTEPNIEEQVKFLMKNHQFSSQSIIITHSLGGVAAMKLLPRLSVKIKKLVMMAPPLRTEFLDNKKREPLERATDWQFDWASIKKAAATIVVMQDTGDDIVPASHPATIAKELGAELVKVLALAPHFRVDESLDILQQALPSIRVFTTRPDTLFGATYMVLAPEHGLVQELKNEIANWPEVEKYIKTAVAKTQLERTDLAKAKTGVELKGVKAINPGNKEEIPVWIADYVLSSYGTGAIMAVPAHDERDFEFAKKFGLEIREVISTDDELPSVGNGKMVNSGEFDGMDSEEAKWKITKKVGGKKAIQYRLRDWLISRQRYWGAPIPIIYCEKCGEQAVLEKDLPVELPLDVDFRPTGESPLARSESFHQVKCPKCGGQARRESDTMDTFVDSAWYFLRYTDPKNNKEFAGKDKIKSWLPVDTYVGGAEHAVLHLMYARFFCMALHDFGYLDFDEPFLQLRNQGLILGPDGQKMSKSRGNVINPDEVVENLGADTMRLYEMFMGPLEDAKPWSTDGIIGVRRFLEKAWASYELRVTSYEKKGSKDTVERELHKLIKKTGEDIESFDFNTAVSQFMIFVNAVNKAGEVESEHFETFLKVLSPFAPHLADELWERLGHKEVIEHEAWPKYDENVLIEEEVMYVVQINGKVKANVVLISDASEEDVINRIKELGIVQKYLEGKIIIKYIFIKGKLINFVIK